MPSPLIVGLDLGGVIVDVNRNAGARALGVSAQEFDDAFFDGTGHAEVTVGAISAEAFLRHAAARLQRELDDVRAGWLAVVDTWPDGVAVVEALLAAGHAVHLWSNTDPVHLEKIAAALPRGVVLETVSFLIGAQKPDPRYWQRAAARGRPTIYLDDRPDFVEAARRIGLPAHVCAGPAGARQALVHAGLIGNSVA